MSLSLFLIHFQDEFFIKFRLKKFSLNSNGYYLIFDKLNF
jgi:hypothetical protein